jgi:phage tail sheath protein FI
MGGRTLRNTSNERYINVKRSLIYIKKELENRSQFALFENNDPNLWRRLNTTLSGFLLNFWQSGGLRGATAAQAFFVRVDSSTTSFTDIQNGIVNIEIGVALQYPAEFVVIKLSQLTGNA